MLTADGVEVTDDDRVYRVFDWQLHPALVRILSQCFLGEQVVRERYSTKQAAVAAWIAEEDRAHEIRKARLLAELAAKA